jgi:general secretion pathway protein I
MRRRRAGFSLLEILVAMTILGVAVATLLGAMSGSLRNLSRSGDYDRAVLDGRQKLKELMADSQAPRYRELSGGFAPSRGWRARITAYDISYRPAQAGTPVLDRVEMEIWWQAGAERRSVRLEGYRRGFLQAADILAGGLN